MLASPAAAQFGPPRVVDPATYRSRSGAFTLEVDPSHIHGAGRAGYRLINDRRLVWSGARPFTLLAAGVADDGRVAGYAYSTGLEERLDPGSVHLLILDPDGSVRLDDVTPRRQSRVIHGGPEPSVDGLVFDPDNDRVVFRVSDEGGAETWKPYQLSTGTAAAPFEPKSQIETRDLSVSVVDAQPVRGTTLTLVHWLRSDWRNDQLGAHFTLVDRLGSSVWSLDLPRDYQADTPDREAQERLTRLAGTSALLDVSHPGEFELRHAGSSERVRYRIERQGSGTWRVVESGRQPDASEAAPDAAEDAAEGPQRPLRYLGAVRLGRQADEQGAAIRDVHDFDLDDDGRYGFVRRDGACQLTFVTPAGDGETRQIELGRPGRQECSSPLVAWAGGSTWLVTLEYASADRGHAGFWLDRESGSTRPFTLPDGTSSVRAVAGRRTGGIVLLAERQTVDGPTVVIDTLLVWIDASGREQRAFSDAANNSASELLSPDDVAVTTAGEVVVVDVIRHTVTVFQSDGVLQRTIDLEKSWGREPSYPSGIAPDSEGGFVVEDFGASIPFVRMRADGAVRGELVPRYDDGRPAGRLFRLQAGPDGALWGSDGEALLRLRDDGVVEAAVGAPASVDALGEPAAVAVDGTSRIYAADRRTGAVHVFSAQGNLEHVCRPQPGDVTDSLVWPRLTATNDGRVFLRLDDGLQARGGFLEFSPSGDRVARHAWEDRSRAWNPATGGFWAVRDNELAALTQDGEVTTIVTRRADRRWLGWISGVAVASDGSVAVAADSNLLGPGQKQATLSVYSSDGVPMQAIRLHSGESGAPFAYDGRAVALWQSGDVRVLDLSGQEVARFAPRPAGREAVDWPLFFAAQGHELWLFDSASRTMHRFEMP